MAKTKDSGERRIRPALSPENRENQLIALAVNSAEQQLLNGTASSQIIVHYLKLGAERERSRLENELLEKKIQLAAAKTEAIASEARTEELFKKAIEAMRIYGGNKDEEESE
jgi:hypothetical protein